MEPIESEGKTVAEAVESALKKIGLRRDQVEVQILEEGNAGFMGFGAKPARVKLTEKRWGEPAQASGRPAEKLKPRSSAGYSTAPAAPSRRATENRPAPRSRPAPAPAHVPAPAPAPAPVPAPVAERRQASTPAPERSKCEDPKAACAQAQELTSEVLRLMSFEGAAVTASWDAAQERVKIAVSGQDVEKLAGPNSGALESLQFLMTLMLNRRINAQVAVQVDVAGFWDKREKEILAQVERGIEEVKKTGKPFRLEPMDALMRRLVHRHFAENPDILTASEGEGSWRKIVLRPRKG